MVIYYILKGLDAIVFALISLIPVIETPVWIITQLPDVLFRIASFNWYLPVYETVGVVVFILYITLQYKIAKIALNFAHIDLNK